MTASVPSNIEQTDEKQQLLARLRSSRDCYLAVLASVSEEASSIKPGDGRWSALECAEHVAVAEQLMFQNVEKRRRPTDAAPNYEKDAVIQGIATDRSSRRNAPEPATPTGKFRSLREAIAEFTAVRERTLIYVEQQNEDFRKFTVMHPLAGAIDTYQALAIIAAHSERHAAQIKEITSSPAYLAAAQK